MSGRLRSGLVVALATLAAALLLVGPASATGRRGRACGWRAADIFFIMMDNDEFTQIIGNTADAPFINQLGHAGVAANYYGVTHPSLPNYLAALRQLPGDLGRLPGRRRDHLPARGRIPNSGDGTAGNDSTKPDRMGQRQAAPVRRPKPRRPVAVAPADLAAYMQQLPSPAHWLSHAPTIQTSSGPVTLLVYAQKHNPFVGSSDIDNNRERLRHIVPFDRFAAQPPAGRVPNFVWISPDQCHDMHGVDPTSAALAHKPKRGYPNSGLDHGAIQWATLSCRRPWARSCLARVEHDPLVDRDRLGTRTTTPA